jgi:hypothetical protein
LPIYSIAGLLLILVIYFSHKRHQKAYGDTREMGVYQILV